MRRHAFIVCGRVGHGTTGKVTIPRLFQFHKAISEEEERSDGIQGDKLREVLGDIVYNIRFPTMTEKEFYSGPAVSGFLTPDVSNF